MSAAAPVTLPEVRASVEPLGPLAGRLRAADRILQKERGSRLFLRLSPWVGAAILVVFALDVALHLAGGSRLGLGIAVLLLALGGAAVCAAIAWMKSNSFEHTARVLEARHPRLGSKLINILQLRAQTEDAALAPITRELAAMAITGYAEELKQEPIEQLARTNEVRAEAKRAGWWWLGFVAVLAVGFDVVRVEVPRFFDPFGDHPPYSFTRLEITEPSAEGAQVVYNQGLLMTVKSSGHRPGELFLSYFPAGQPNEVTTVPMFDKGGRGFTQQIENIRTDLIVYAHTKNRHSLSKQRRISVILTPRLTNAWVKITPPAYTGLAPEEKPFSFKTLKALEGSKLEFRLESNRPMGTGHITVTMANKVEGVDLAASGDMEVSGGLVATQPGQLQFSIVDRDGYAAQETWQCTLTVTHDLPPEVQVSNPSTDSFVAMDFKAEPVIEASDDYGVKTLRIHTGRNGVFGEPRVVTPEGVALHAREQLTFNFQEMGLASGDTVSVFAEAIDNAPEPHIARSKTVTFTVITTEEYNEFLRERTDMADIEAKYSKLVNAFHDLVEEQKKLSEEIAALKEQLAKAKTDAEKAAAQAKMDELVAKQNALNEELKKLADVMENFVRNQPLYDIEAELKNTLAEKAQEIRDSVKKNEEAMKDAQAQNSPQGQQPQQGEQGQQGQQGKPSAGGQQAPSQKMLDDFKLASDEQAARLGETERETREQVEKPLEDLSLMHEIIKDVNRFKELYAAQQELAKQAAAYDRTTPLSREDQLALKDLAAQQKSIGDQLDAVEQKLWEDGKAAEEKFPKAAESAKNMAEQMGDLKFQILAKKATGEMLAGNGSNGAHLAENLRSEMEKMFSKCEGKEGEMGNELDQYLSIQRGMKPGMNFKQMMQTRKFGSGSKPGFSPGKGNGGSDGYAVTTGENPNVLGNETRLSESEKAEISGNGKNKTPPNAAEAKVALDKPDVVQGVNAVNRESEAVQGETSIEQYSDLVEKYFKALTRDPKKTK
jgi:hypothetical protein